MDASGLRERIKATVDPDATTRQAAEAELKAVRLDVANDDGYQIDCLTGRRKPGLS